MCDHGKLEWVEWTIRFCPQSGKVYIEAVNQTGRRDAFLAFTTEEFADFADAAERVAKACRQPVAG
jgi:hypothetical protein